MQHCIITSTVKRLITSKIKVSVYIIYMCVLCIFIMSIKTHTYSICFENIYMYIHIIYIINIFNI